MFIVLDVHKQWLYLAPLTTGVVLASQSAKAFGPSTGGIETIIPLGRAGGSADEISAIIGLCLILGFSTSLGIYWISSSRKTGKKFRFLATLFADFSFDNFIIPGLGTLSLLIAYSLFWSWTYGLICSALLGNMTFIAFVFLFLTGLVTYVALRGVIESVVAIAKMADSANAILNRLNRDNAEEDELWSSADLPLASLDDQRVGMLIDGKPVSNDEEA